MKVNCSCKHEYQDQKYGKGVRVATPVNKTLDKGILRAVRCTVCSKEHSKFKS